MTELLVVIADRRIMGEIRRLHQEDMCQVLGLPPTKKYENEGGPGCAELGETIRTYSGEPGDDAWTFARATMLNWIIGGTDAHGKISRCSSALADEHASHRSTTSQARCLTTSIQKG